MSQKALLLHEVGKPLVLGDRPIPKPGHDELLVKVLVGGLSPHDQNTRDLGLFVNKTPYVLASDLVGEVVTIGSGEHAAAFAVGERVFGHAFSEGGWDSDFNAAQQYALADARYVGRVAESGLSDDEASTIPVTVLAAYTALFAKAGLGLPAPSSQQAKSFDYSEITLLVLGGGSNTGKAVIELAALVGIGRIIALAGKRNEALLKSIGATDVVDRDAADTVEQIREITGDELIYAIDTVNVAAGQELGLAALSNSRKGTLITLRRPRGEFDDSRRGSKSAGFERRQILGVSPLNPEVTVDFWKDIPGWLKEGKVRPSRFNVIEGLNADAVNKALDDYRSGKGTKTNIHPWA